jgi:uncharacterized protein YndB with AHSA1/START domain
MVRATVRLPGCSPERALAAFTDPATLAEWWGGELTTNLTRGGPYIVRFPRLGRAMTGEILGYEPPSHLEFTWSWEGEPTETRRTVLVTVTGETANGGTELAVTHGPHGDDAAERTARTEHREGWEYFLPRLAALVSG